MCMFTGDFISTVVTLNFINENIFTISWIIVFSRCWILFFLDTKAFNSVISTFP